MKKILIVEDSLDLMELLIDLLADQGFQCLSAFNGKEALDLLESLDSLPDAILLDLMMPVMTGEEFLNARKNSINVEINRIPVVIFTAQGDTQAVFRLSKDYTVLRKPARTQEIIDAFAKVIDTQTIEGGITA